jgi:hypothetical protein
METEKISSLKELQKQMPRIIEKYGNNQELTLIALTNPLLALEKIGYTFTPAGREEIETYIRFGKDGVAELNKLKENIFAITGQTFDLEDASKVQTVLSAALLKDAPVAKAKAIANQSLPKEEVDAIVKVAGKSAKVVGSRVLDSLEAYRTKHPVMAPLLEYRKLQALAPQLATKKVSDAIIRKKDALPFSKITFRLNRK